MFSYRSGGSNDEIDATGLEEQLTLDLEHELWPRRRQSAVYLLVGPRESRVAEPDTLGCRIDRAKEFRCLSVFFREGIEKLGLDIVSDVLYSRT